MSGPVFGELVPCSECKGRGDVPYTAVEARAVRLELVMRRPSKEPPKRKKCPTCGGAGYVPRSAPPTRRVGAAVGTTPLAPAPDEGSS